MILLGLEIVLFGGSTLACSYWGVVSFNEWVDESINQWLSVESEENRETALVLKSEFQGVVIKPLLPQVNHTHGESAAARSTGTLLALTVSEGIGRTPYFLQGSGANSRAGLAYSRKYFWAKDMNCPYRRFDPGPTDVLCIVDVDYYVDMTDLLIERFQPYIMYSLVPSAAAKDRGDYGYCFDSTGKIKYHVAGGGEYHHYLWDWDGDSVRVVKRLLGFPVQMAVYGIERRQIDADHQLILLVPMYKSTNPLTTWLAHDRLEARSLKHFNPIVGDFVRFHKVVPEGLEVVTGKPGEYHSCSLPARIDSAIASAAKTMTGKLSLSTVKSKMSEGAVKEGQTFQGAEVLLEFHLSRQPTTARVSLVDSVRRFQFVPRGAEPDVDAKPGMSAFMTPLLHGGFVPDACEGNDRRYVDKRILEMRSKDLPIDSFMVRTMEEFVSFLIPEDVKHTLHPVDLDEVFERQNRPSQRAILHAADHGLHVREVKSFMKREAYGRVNDPRGISTINGADKRDYSMFMYSYKDNVMKVQSWYAFGKSPRQVAERVAEVAQSARTMCNHDMERMDGRKGNVLAFFKRMAMTRAFHPSYHNQLIEIINGLERQPAHTPHGVHYKTNLEQLSGSPDTSDSNTQDTAYIAYLTYRYMGYKPLEAWCRLGVYGGDDGVSADMEPKMAMKASTRVGQVLKLEPVAYGERGVTFLSRHYGPGVWFGDTNSCCDIKRQLAKIHLTVNLPSNVTPATKLREKAFAYALTDANTPVIGEFVRKVLEIYPTSSEQFKNELGIWGVEMDAERQYVNKHDEWMDDLLDSQLPDFDVRSFREWIGGATSGTILSPPGFAPPLPPNPKPGIVAVDGDIVVPRSVEPAPAGTDGQNSTRADGKAHYRARKPRPERPSHQMKEQPKRKLKKTTKT